MSLKFRADIEGLRALAVLPVVAFHAFPQAVPGGFIGVDIFFVISGFLITQLLLQRLDSDQYSIASFYAARVRRIFPALFVMLALCVPAAVALLSPVDLKAFGRTLAATALFFSNLELYRTTDYFAVTTELNPLVHTWSLAVEEQYYIVFPVVLALFYRRWPRALFPVLAVVGVASLMLSVWLLNRDAPLAFYSAFSRTFELMTGSLLAATSGRFLLTRAVREVMAAAGVATILSACLFMSAKTPFPGLAALPPCVGAALLIAAGQEGLTWTGKLVAIKPLRWFGALSFSLYLWHWPVLVFTRHLVLGEPQHWHVVLAVAVAIVLAYMSLKWVEGPVRRAALGQRSLLAIAALCISATLAVSWLLAERTQHLQALSDRQTQLYAAASDVSPKRRQCHGGQSVRIAYNDRCLFGDTSAQRQTAVWADSHGVELAFALGERGKVQGFAVAQITSSSCPPSPGYRLHADSTCLAHNDAMLTALVSDPRVDRVVLAARFGVYLADDAEAFQLAFTKSVRALVAAGKKVVLIEPLPTYPYPVPAALAALNRRGERETQWQQSRAAYLDANDSALSFLNRLAAEPSVTVWRVSESICASEQCLVQILGKPLYFDDNHLSMQGARWLADSLAADW